MEKSCNKNAHYVTRGFTKLFNKYRIKFKKEIDAYFLSLGEDGFACIRNPFTANAANV